MIQLTSALLIALNIAGLITTPLPALITALKVRLLMIQHGDAWRCVLLILLLMLILQIENASMPVLHLIWLQRWEEYAY
jgi:hypothetical protein